DAREMRDNAKDLRDDAARSGEPAKGRLLARADDLEVRAAMAQASATTSAAEAKEARARAKELRAQAKARVGQAPAAAKGTLTVAGRSCELSIDGVPAGTTPILRRTVAAGVHQLECRAIGGGARRAKTITVRDGASVSVAFAFEDALDPFY